ncbi:MAG: DMT family transporter [Firmicutes bacterium]|nr:DMT family transporter [Bacillota bacterium]
MSNRTLRSNLYLLLTAAIWGLAFVAQRVGARYVEPFAFNGVRFALGGLSLIPLLVLSAKKSGPKPGFKPGNALPAGIIAGTVLFIASSLQQIGLAETEAGKAAFITGLYMVIVPLLGIFLKHQIHLFNWIGVAIAGTGLYFLSVSGGFSVVRGDLLELGGAFFWALHLLLIDNFIKKADLLKLSFFQFLTCSLLSTAVALFTESAAWDALRHAVIPILYGGIFSVGIAYTLQAAGQKYAKPSHAAIILSLEAVFAAVGGLVILGEKLGARGYLGCLLMLTGMLVSQFQSIQKTPTNTL